MRAASVHQSGTTNAPVAVAAFVPPATAGVPAAAGWSVQPAVTLWIGRIATGLGVTAVALVTALAAAPHVLPVQEFTVLSGSMQPTIPVASVVIATPIPASKLRVGDIITFQPPNHPDRLVTHRVIQIAQTPSGPVFETKGDANAAPDGWELTATAPVYRYLFHIPLLGYLIVAGQSTAVRLAIALVGALGLLALWWRSGD